MLIPEDYVPDLNVRLALYRRLSDAEKAEDREALAAELIDRFGPLPPEADQLLKVVAIKGLCREANVAKIDVGPKGAVVAFRDDDFANPGGLVGFVQKNAGRLAPAARPEGGGQGRVGDPARSASPPPNASSPNWPSSPRVRAPSRSSIAGRRPLRRPRLRRPRAASSSTAPRPSARR